MLIKLDVTNEAEAKTEVLRLSELRPRHYFYVVQDFDTFAVESKCLHVNAPGDSACDWYAHGGKIKAFTDPQRGADQRATPTLS